MRKFEFGVRVKDRVTGFTGIATGYASYITGCNQYLVQPKAKESNGISEFTESRWLDEGRLDQLSEGPEVTIDRTDTVEVGIGSKGPDRLAPIR